MSQIRFEEQQYNTESLDAGLWKRIFVLMRPLRKELVRLLILMVAVAGCDVLFPILNKIAIDTFAKSCSLSVSTFSASSTSDSISFSCAVLSTLPAAFAFCTSEENLVNPVKNIIRFWLSCLFLSGEIITGKTS